MTVKGLTSSSKRSVFSSQLLIFHHFLSCCVSRSSEITEIIFLLVRTDNSHQVVCGTLQIKRLDKKCKNKSKPSFIWSSKLANFPAYILISINQLYEVHPGTLFKLYWVSMYVGHFLVAFPSISGPISISKNLYCFVYLFIYLLHFLK